MQARSPAWGWVRRGEISKRLQVLGWSDGSAKGSAGAFGWVLVSRGTSMMDLTLEGVGGGWAPDMDSCGAEALGALALTEALRLRAGNLPRPRGWAECPSEVWTQTYNRVLQQTRAPPTSKWGLLEDEGFILEQLYENNWNQ